MPGMDRARAVKAALTQAAAVAVLSIALAIALPHSFFDDYGWVAGPAAWALCALVTARVLSLPPGWTLLGAAVGVPMRRRGWGVSAGPTSTLGSNSVPASGT